MAKKELGKLVGSIQQSLPAGDVEDGPINWDVLAPASAPYAGVLVPTYLLYGGPNYTGGQVLQPGDVPSYALPAGDLLDAAFKTHDQAYDGATLPQRAAADVDLLQAISLLGDNDLGPEGHLYAGLTTFIVLAQVTQYPAGTLSPDDSFYLLTNGTSLIADALANLAVAGIEPARHEVVDLAKWVGATLDLVAAVNPVLADAVTDAVLGGDAFDFSALARGAPDALPKIDHVKDVAAVASDVELPQVVLDHLPVLSDLPAIAREHVPEWLLA